MATAKRSFLYLLYQSECVPPGLRCIYFLLEPLGSVSSASVYLMNCFLETLASMWLMSRRSLGLQTPIYEDETVHENLEGCRMSLEAKESELVEACKRLAREALRRKQQGDLVGARTKLTERRRGLKRLEKLRNNLVLVSGQIDALQSTELDRELMQTLLASSAALKRAGVGKGIKEAEEVMTQLDEQMRESSELTSVLANPLHDDMDFEVEEELDMLLREGELGGSQHAVVNSIGSVAVPVSVQVLDVDSRQRAREPVQEIVPETGADGQLVASGIV